ncbi:MAG: hypothetical protein EHM24_06170 [Acidobacteria bacterium]|nr:MAG: hypothetical protein EHM24_24990 [Acidobacteriota bacterium]RPJ74405.1 MAG: hypothetical protein EHM24_06170 [Acidobacteriota bacterium]
MRWFLALALVLQFTGLPAVGGVVCSAAATGGHSCCKPESSAGSGERISSHCGCAMVPAAPAEHRRPIGIAPESRDADSAAPAHDASLIGIPVRSGLTPRDLIRRASPAIAFLSGAGFRC